jgi:hypothetical protein
VRRREHDAACLPGRRPVATVEHPSRGRRPHGRDRHPAARSGRRLWHRWSLAALEPPGQRHYRHPEPWRHVAHVGRRTQHHEPVWLFRSRPAMPRCAGAPTHDRRLLVVRSRRRRGRAARSSATNSTNIRRHDRR